MVLHFYLPATHTTHDTIGFSRMVLHFYLPATYMTRDTIGFSRMVLHFNLHHYDARHHRP